jgi:hypothetical protein
MNFAADCLAATGLDSTQLVLGFAIALGAIAVGLALFGRTWRNRAALALTPFLILAGIASMGGLALATSSPAQAAASCEPATPSAAPTGDAPVLQAIVYGDYRTQSPYVPNPKAYPSLNAATVYLPICEWNQFSLSPDFEQQITALGDGTISYTATGLEAPDAMTTSGVISFHPTNTGYGYGSGDRSFAFIVTATSDFGTDTKTYTATTYEVGCGG